MFFSMLSTVFTLSNTFDFDFFAFDSFDFDFVLEFDFELELDFVLEVDFVLAFEHVLVLELWSEFGVDLDFDFGVASFLTFPRKLFTPFQVRLRVIGVRSRVSTTLSARVLFVASVPISRSSPQLPILVTSDISLHGSSFVGCSGFCLSIITTSLNKLL